MQIKDPKFKEGQKVMYEGNLYIVVEISSYSFTYNEYLYRIEDDVKQCVKSEEELEPYVEKPKTIWDLKVGDKCYFINVNGSVLSGPWDGNPLQIGSRKTGNAFLTKEEAENEAERRKIETEMIRLGGRRNFKFDGDNYGIFYCEGINVVLFHLAMYQGIIYFDTIKNAHDAIKEIGKNRIIKYVFGVES